MVLQAETKGGAFDGAKEHVKEEHKVKDGKETHTFSKEVKH